MSATNTQPDHLRTTHTGHLSDPHVLGVGCQTASL
jgi:hypothetical protein